MGVGAEVSNRVVNISGGTVDDIEVNSGAVANISGGSISSVLATANSVVNLFGSEFFLDGVKLDTLQPGQAFTITDRGGGRTLLGVLEDGELFSFGLEPRFSSLSVFDSESTLTVTLTVPFLLGDYNLDGVVNSSDIPPLIELLQSGSYLEQADCDQDGDLDFSDIPAFIAILTSL